MPATGSGKAPGAFVLGADGCRAGWVVARLALDDDKAAADIAPDFATVLKRAQKARMIMVDMPIGLAEDGPRACEREARALLKPLRHSSVFSSPRRPMLDFETYAEANAWGKARQRAATGAEQGGGLSKQAWMIAPKIREVDAAIAPRHQARLGEAHPEVAFWRLNGEKPCRFSKRTREGQDERRALLRRGGVEPDALLDRIRDIAGRGAGVDDVLDACAIALTAKARLAGKAVRLGDGARDRRGLRMEIWG